MFLNFYNLNDQPFGMTPDPGFIFWSDSHREALSSLYYGIESGCGFLTLIAAPGMGKTTLLFHLLDRLRTFSRTVYIFQTQCDSREFLRYMMADLGWDSDEQDVVVLFGKLYEILLAESRAEKRFVLIVDEAQNLDNSVLEMVRLLSDFETWSHKLIQVVLVGQPQLATKLASLDLWQLRQRISIISRLKPLTPDEVGEYIKHRCRVAGYDGPPLFDAEAVDLITSASDGIPRVINNLCFNALTLGYAERLREINASIIREVIADLELVLPEAVDPGKAIPAAAGKPARAWRADRDTGVRRALRNSFASCSRLLFGALRPSRGAKPASESHPIGTRPDPLFGKDSDGSIDRGSEGQPLPEPGGRESLTAFRQGTTDEPELRQPAQRK